MEEFKPGQVISPQSAVPQPPQPIPQPNGAPVPERPTEPAPMPTPAPSPGPESTQSTIEPIAYDTAETENIPATNVAAHSVDWQYTSETDVSRSAEHPALPSELTWTASEFINHEKSVSWYAGIVLAGVIIAVLDYLIIKDLFSSIIILFAAIAFAAFAARKPQIQQYQLHATGLIIGNKSYEFQDFKTFSIVQEGAIASIVFMPLKRFMPPLTIYVAPDMEDSVVEYLSSFLPYAEHQGDAVDTLLRNIRF